MKKEDMIKEILAEIKGLLALIDEIEDKPVKLTSRFKGTHKETYFYNTDVD